MNISDPALLLATLSHVALAATWFFAWYADMEQRKLNRMVNDQLWHIDRCLQELASEFERVANEIREAGEIK